MDNLIAVSIRIDVHEQDGFVKIALVRESIDGDQIVAHGNFAHATWTPGADVALDNLNIAALITGVRVRNVLPAAKAE